jgi:hypothetical protein
VPETRSTVEMAERSKAEASGAVPPREAHVLHFPTPPPREQLCNRYCSNKHTQETDAIIGRLRTLQCQERRSRPSLVQVIQVLFECILNFKQGSQGRRSRWWSQLGWWWLCVVEKDLLLLRVGYVRIPCSSSKGGREFVCCESPTGIRLVTSYFYALD